MTWILHTQIGFPILQMLHIKFGQAATDEMLEYYGDIHVYCHSEGADEPLKSPFFPDINIQSNCPFPARLSL